MTEATAASPFVRGEHALAHTVYGLILAVATLGELIDHEIDAIDGAAALYAAGLVLFVAHVFADAFARMIAREGDVGVRSMLRIGRRDVAVALGGLVLGSAMLLAHLTDADPSGAMTGCFVGAMAWLALQTFFALHREALAVRFVMAILAVALAGIIVALENLH